MCKRIRNVLTLIVAVALMFSSCASNETTEETEALSSETVIDTTEMSATEMSEEVSPELIVAENTEATETTEAFDIHNYTFDTIHGSQLNCYLNHQYYFAEQPIPVTESNYYFIKAFIQLSEDALAHNYYPVTSEGYIDLAAEIPVGDNGETPLYKTYGDMFRSYAETSLYSTYIILDNAKALGVTLSDDDIQKVEDSLYAIENDEALPAGMSLEEYLKVYYGPDCTVETFRQVLLNFYTNDAFTKFYLENFDYGDMATIMSPTVRFAAFRLNDSEAGDEMSDEAKADVHAKAQAMLEQCDGSIDALKDLGSEAYANGECSLYGETALVQGQVQIADVVDEWCLNPERVSGDMTVIDVESYGSVVVGFVDIVENYAAMEQIAVENLTKQVNANIVNNTYAFHTNDSFLPPPTVAAESETINGEETAVQSEEVSVTEETESLAEPAETDASEVSSQETDEDSSTHDVIYIIGIILCLMILILLIILFVRLNSRNKNTEENEEES